MGVTPSTTNMWKSQQSFNRMDESTASELQALGTKSRNAANGTAGHTNGNHLSVFQPTAPPATTKHTKTNGHPNKKDSN